MAAMAEEAVVKWLIPTGWSSAIVLKNSVKVVRGRVFGVVKPSTQK
jgi:hypothetical protein